jgi:hypothetical protein
MSRLVISFSYFLDRLRIRFSLQHFLLVYIAATVGLGFWLLTSQRQIRVVKALRAAGGTVSYQVGGQAVPAYHLIGDSANKSPRQSWVPHVLLEKLGVDYFHTVVGVDFRFLPGKKEDQLRAFADLEQLGSLSQLSITVASQQQIPSEQVFDTLEKLHLLRDLAIYGEGLLPDEGCTLAPLPLESITIVAKDLNDQRCWVLRGLTGLKSLHLRGNITDQVLPQIAEHTQLESLTLEGRFTPDGITRLTPLTNLERLSLINAGEETGYDRDQGRDFVETIARQFRRLQRLQIWSVSSAEDLKPLLGHPRLKQLELNHLMRYSLNDVRRMFPNITVSAEID